MNEVQKVTNSLCCTVKIHRRSIATRVAWCLKAYIIDHSRSQSGEYSVWSSTLYSIGGILGPRDAWSSCVRQQVVHKTLYGLENRTELLSTERSFQRLQYVCPLCPTRPHRIFQCLVLSTFLSNYIATLLTPEKGATQHV